MVAILAGCSSKPTDKGQQCRDGKFYFSQPFSLVNRPDAVGAPINEGGDLLYKLTRFVLRLRASIIARAMFTVPFSSGYVTVKFDAPAS